jgi:hypothetical protein
MRRAPVVVGCVAAASLFAAGAQARVLTPPDLHLPGTITAEATGPKGAVVIYEASATDSDDKIVSFSCSPASGSTFPIGTTTVNCQATDQRENTSKGSFKVVVRDTTPPTISGASDVTAEAAGPSGAVVTYPTPTASDLVSGSVPVTCAPPSGATFPLGRTPVTCTATDSHGNKGTATFGVTVRDTRPPVLTGVPGPLRLVSDGPEGALLTYAIPAATDDVDGAVPVTCTPQPGARLPVGKSIVNCMAADKAGNKASTSFDVTVATPAGVEQLPPPSQAVVMPTGTVLVKLPGQPGFHALKLGRVPYGSEFDVTHGKVTLTTSDGSFGTFYAGRFALAGGRDTNGAALTELRLTGGDFGICKRALAARAKPKPKVVRQLWGNGKGHFRTKGRYASATVRGTVWLTQDRCDGTLVKVMQGRVAVTSLKTHKSVTIGAGRSRLVRAR